MRNILIVITLVLAPLGYVSAATYQISPDGSGDYPTIEAGLGAVSAGDTLMLLCGEYFEYNLTIVPGVVLISETGSADCVTINAQMNGRVLYCYGADSSTKIIGLSITNGSAPPSGGYIGGGGLRCENSSPEIRDCVFSDNSSSWGGGAIFCQLGSSPTISGCNFYNNSCSQPGGAIYYHESSPIIDTSVFVHNTAEQGGAIFSDWGSSSTIYGCTIVDNTTTLEGSGIYCRYTSPSISNTIYAYGNGGEAVYAHGGGEPQLVCCDIYDNEGGDWVGYISTQLGVNGNIAEYPGFCDSVEGNYTLSDMSPCAIENSECGQIGALGVACSLAPGGVHVSSVTGSNETGDGTAEHPYMTIQYGLDMAAPGDTVLVWDGVYIGDGNRDLDFYGRSIYLKSLGGQPDNCVINCGGSVRDYHRALYFHSGEDSFAVVDGFKIIGGYAKYGGGALVMGLDVWEQYDESGDGGAPKIINCVFTGNTAVSEGAAIAALGLYSRPIVIGTEVIYNNGSGGYWDSQSCVIRIEDSMFVGNTGDGIQENSYSDGYFGCDGIITNCTFSGNGQNGFSCSPFSSTGHTIHSCEVTANSGAGIYFEGGECAGAIIDSDIYNNGGDGVYMRSLNGYMRVESSRVFGNGGYGVYDMSGWAELHDLTVSQNDSMGVYLESGHANVTNCTIDNNESGMMVFAYETDQPSVINITHNTISSNTTYGMHVTADHVLEMNNLLITYNGGSACLVAGEHVPQYACTDIYGNEVLNWDGVIEGQAAVNGNIQLRPLFCDAAGGDFRLLSTSPCIDDNNDACGTIGAQAVGCQPDILDIAEIKSYNPGTGQPNSPYLDHIVSVDGIVYVESGTFSEGGFYLEDQTGGINFYHDCPTVTPTVGDHIQITGVLWCDSNNELFIGWPGIHVVAPGPDPAPTQYSIANLLSDYEHIGDYVTVFGNVASVGSAPFVLEQGGVAVEVRINEDTGVDISGISIGDIYRVSGPCLIDEGTIWLSPRYQTDLVQLDGSMPTGIDYDLAPATFTLYSCSPNPFNPRTTIRYDLPSDCYVKLIVYDLAGHQVRTLVGEDIQAGRHDAVWDGREDSGRRSPAGVYFYHLEAGELSDTKRMTLVK